MYGKTPANFLLDLLKLRLPELLNTEVNTVCEQELEKNVRDFIKDDDRITRRLFLSVEGLLVSLLS